MVAVNLWSGLRRLADDQVVVTVEASTIREMLDALVTAHPALAPVIKSGISIVVDGTMVTSNATPVSPQSEVYLIQRIAGG